MSNNRPQSDELRAEAFLKKLSTAGSIKILDFARRKEHTFELGDWSIVVMRCMLNASSSKMIRFLNDLEKACDAIDLDCVCVMLERQLRNIIQDEIPADAKELYSGIEALDRKARRALRKFNPSTQNYEENMADYKKLDDLVQRVFLLSSSSDFVLNPINALISFVYRLDRKYKGTVSSDLATEIDDLVKEVQDMYEIAIALTFNQRKKDDFRRDLEELSQEITSEPRTEELRDHLKDGVKELGKYITERHAVNVRKNVAFTCSPMPSVEVPQDSLAPSVPTYRKNA